MGSIKLIFPTFFLKSAGRIIEIFQCLSWSWCTLQRMNKNLGQKSPIIWQVIMFFMHISNNIREQIWLISMVFNILVAFHEISGGKDITMVTFIRHLWDICSQGENTTNCEIIGKRTCHAVIFQSNTKYKKVECFWCLMRSLTKENVPKVEQRFPLM